MKTICKMCKVNTTLVTGWPWCESCASSEDSRKQLGVATLADAIVQLEQAGVPLADQTEFFIAHGIDRMRLDAAHAHVVDRYNAAQMKRPRASRGW
jgi:hypothetical protein